MKIIAQPTTPQEVQADWLVVALWEDEGTPKNLQTLDGQIGGAIAALRETGDIAGKSKETTPLLNCKGIAAKRILVVGLGKRAAADRFGLYGAAAAAARFVNKRKTQRIAFVLPDDVPNLTPSDTALSVAAGFAFGASGPWLHKSKLDRFPPEELVLLAAAEEVALAAQRADIEARAVGLARDLVNTPPCDLYPETFAERARQVAAAGGFECIIYDEKQLEGQRMGSLLAVARGSDRPPRLAVLRYRGGGNGKTLGLVGKGVTFDSGGLSLKTTDQMLDMKCDMSGAAAVLGAVQAIAELKLPVNVLGVMALVENMPSGKAMKLGDVLRARNGKTIEVWNTDAEGRLILADALAYAVDLKCTHLVDLATLTGACMVALGADVAGVMSNNDSWSGKVLEACRTAGERAWQLPMYSFYTEMIQSDIADMKNTGGSRYAGAITAAKLLEEFVSDTPWVHLDIAGPAWVEKENAVRASGGTGCFVRSLVELARSYPAS